jgi:hypothetical protein
MAKTLNRPTGQFPDAVTEDPHKKADAWLLTGIIVAGSFILGPIALAMMAYGFILLRRAQGRGVAIRPWHVTIIAAFAMMDGAANFVGWAVDLLPIHDTLLGRTLYFGWGKMFDAGYYINYNGLPIGGTAAAGEKAFEFMAVFIMFPMRMVACWAFMKMKRWGYQYMIVTAWMQFMFWFGYHVNVAMTLENRFGATLYGVTGWWAYDIVYMVTPLVLIPYLHTINREMFTD